MANYYNLRGWKKTGINRMNRPFSPEKLNDIMAGKEYFQLSSIQVNRSDIYGLTYIDVQGSVKDMGGVQIGNPSQHGSQGPGGPFVDLEELDYACLIRTGYPGDNDFVNIGNSQDAYNNTAVNSAFFFVGTPIPLSRNVTRLPLELDAWTTMMLDPNIEMGGFKIRGPITDIEDAQSFNLSAEDYTLSEPLYVRDAQPVDVGSTGDYKLFAVSPADLEQYEIDENPTAFLVETEPSSRQISTAVPRINRSYSSDIKINTLDDENTASFQNLGFYDPFDSKVQYNLNVLYSLNNTNIIISNYKVPDEWVTTIKQGGFYRTISNMTKDVLSPVQGSGLQNIYPRKATYMFAQMVLVNESSGDIDIQPIYNLPDFFENKQRLEGWSIPLPGGCPYMRFKNIKDHPLRFDKAVKGGQWQNQSMIMEGAAGSIISSYNMQYNQQMAKRQIWDNFWDWATGFSNDVAGMTNQVGQMGLNQNYKALNTNPSLSQSIQYNSQQLAGGSGLISHALSMAGNVIQNDRANDRVQIENKNQVNQYMLSQCRAPYPETLPGFSSSAYTKNRFFVMLLWPTQKCQIEARYYFNLFGYRNLFKNLNKLTINVKQNVNYCQSLGAWFRSSAIPQRVCDAAADVINKGCWFWNTSVDFTKFANQPDNN